MSELTDTARASRKTLAGIGFGHIAVSDYCGCDVGLIDRNWNFESRRDVSASAGLCDCAIGDTCRVCAIMQGFHQIGCTLSLKADFFVDRHGLVPSKNRLDSSSAGVLSGHQDFAIQFLLFQR